MSIPQSSYDSIARLVETYRDVAAGGKAMEFDETSTRITLLNPFWDALGWKMADPREVVHEKRVHTRQGIKRADYCFNVRGKPSFVLEAKQAGVSLRDPDVVFQAKRYGYNLPVNFAVISDFEEFRLFDSGLEPLYNNPGRGLIKQFDLTWDQYLDNWNDLYATFSREAVYDGTLDELLPKARRTRNKEALDRKFFERLTKWREKFARVLALDNGDLHVYDINEAVQRILDRIIFIRVIEDREIEPIEHLQDALSRWGRERERPLYRYVVDVFRKMDPQYNGQLFARHFSEELLLRDKPLADFIKSLYYPECPYQFNAIGVEMLGTIYERFLGSTITLTPAHRAKVEQKPEVRKAGGVYYTPAYIVDYIVENTVGELLSKCKKPNDALKLKILDPACGSGSFLLGAFGRLIDWFEDFYNERPEKISKAPKAECWYDEAHPDGPRWRLTARYKGEILRKCIYGVDIDPQAVEVTIMSLYLRVLESVNVGLLMKTALLPPLEGNVKCGNSLIGSDYWDFVRENQGELFERGEAEERRVNTFDWDVEFPDIVRHKPGGRDLAEGYGFDAVIGNPPYVEFKRLDSRIKAGIERIYKTATGKYDIFVPFIELSVNILAETGYFSLITPSTFINRYYGKRIREFLSDEVTLTNVVFFNDFQVFEGATNYPIIITANKKKGIASTQIIKILSGRNLAKDNVELALNGNNRSIQIKQFDVNSDGFSGDNWVLEPRDNVQLKVKIEDLKTTVRLGDLSEYIYEGIASGKDGVFYVDEELVKEANLESDLVLPIYYGKDIRRYYTNWSKRYVVYPYNKSNNDVIPEKELADNYPNVYQYLVSQKGELKGRGYFDKSNKKWYELWCERNLGKFQIPKIIVAEISPENRFVIDNEGYLGNTKTFHLVLNSKDLRYMKYILGLLNSKLMNFYHKIVSVPKAGGFYEYKTQFLNLYPIREIDFSDAGDVEKHDRMVALVDEMLNLHKRLATAKSDSDRTRLERAIKTADAKIDRLVYGLYGLTKEEIKVVEVT